MTQKFAIINGICITLTSPENDVNLLIPKGNACECAELIQINSFVKLILSDDAVSEGLGARRGQAASKQGMLPRTSSRVAASTSAAMQACM